MALGSTIIAAWGYHEQENAGDAENGREFYGKFRGGDCVTPLGSADSTVGGARTVPKHRGAACVARLNGLTPAAVRPRGMQQKAQGGRCGR